MENDVTSAWEKNAGEWIRAMQEGQLVSRHFTNPAIEEALFSLPGSKVLDMGCGEGWLVRNLTKAGKHAVGVDGTAALIDFAKQRAGIFYQTTFEEVAKGTKLHGAPYDLIVFNFSIYLAATLKDLLVSLKNVLSENGHLVIQTLHPFFFMEQNLPYTSQTMPDSWEGLSGNWSDGHSWYARTFEDWIAILRDSGYHLKRLQEVCNKEKRPLSVIFTLTVR